MRNQVLDDYEGKVGLPENNAPGDNAELQEYLSMDRQVIEAMSPNRAISISIRLSQYQFYLQRCLNREKAIKTWSESELNSIAAVSISQYDKFLKHDMKMALIAKDNSAAKELYKMLAYATQRIDRLSELSSGIKNLSYVISLIYKHKLGEAS